MAIKKPKFVKLPKKVAKSATPQAKLRFLEREKEVNAENDRRQKEYEAKVKADKDLTAKVDKAVNNRKKRK
jgi:hypothetical protein